MPAILRPSTPLRRIMIACVLALSVFAPSLAWAETPFQRFQGQTALDTMQAIAAEGFRQSDVVVIASSNGYWDALCATALAGALDAPVLLTEPDTLSWQTSQTITSLKAHTAYVTGGPLSVSEATYRQIQTLCPTVKRLSGDDAPGTARAIAEEMRAMRQGSASAGASCIIATVDTFQDALSISPYAWKSATPIFLTQPGAQPLSESTLAAIDAGGYNHAVLVGGTYSVSGAVEQQLAQRNMGFTRLAGQDCYATTVEVAKWEVAQGMSYERVGAATAVSYYDGLTGGALCGKLNAPLVLVDDWSRWGVEQCVDPYRDRIASGSIFGGVLSVTEATERALKGIPDPAPDIQINEYLQPSLYHGPKGADYQKYIMLHDTEGNGSPYNVVDWWLYAGQRVAAHFVIGKDGTIVQCVPLDQIAHHAGYGNTGHNAAFGVSEDGRDDMVGSVPIGSWASDYGMNAWSVGIELVHVGGEGYYPQAQLEALDRLIAYIDWYFGFESTITDHKAWRSGNSDTSPEFAGYLANYIDHRTHY